MTDVPADSCSHAGPGPRVGRTALLLASATAVLLAAPALVARLIDPSIAEGESVCPFLHATGVPCPACGATRAFVLMAHGDGGGALGFNWTWIVIWAVAVAGLGVAAWRSATGRRAAPAWLRSAGRWLQRHPVAVAALPFVILAGPWAVAISNINAIR